MDPLKELFKAKAFPVRDELKAVLKEHGELKIADVKVSQLIGGMRSIKSMLWETSLLDPAFASEVILSLNLSKNFQRQKEIQSHCRKDFSG